MARPRVPCACGMSSDRLELRARSSTVSPEFQNTDWLNNVMDHLYAFKDVIDAEKACVESLVDSGHTSKTTPYLFQIEKSFLAISSPSLTDGTFYLSLFLVGRQLYCRFFESGVFEGYFNSEGLPYLRRSLESSYDSFQRDHLLWCQVYNKGDISSYDSRYTKQLQAKRVLTEPKTSNDVGRRYNSILKENKTSIINSHRNLMAKTQEDGENVSCKLLGTIMYTMKSKSLDGICTGFLECSGKFHPAVQDWKKAFLEVRTENNQCKQSFSWKQIFSPLENDIWSWDQQCLMLASIPNNHYWKEGSQQSHLGFSQILSVSDVTGKYNPKSPRNLMLFYFRNGNYCGLYEFLKKLLSPDSIYSQLQQSTEMDTEYEPPSKHHRNS